MKSFVLMGQIFGEKQIYLTSCTRINTEADLNVNQKAGEKERNIKDDRRENIKMQFLWFKSINGHVLF